MGLLSSITGDGLLGGALGFLGQRSANKANSAQAARSLEFQREMAKNAHQYEVADLKKAGLNPLLSGTGGKGASASGGAQAKIENEVNSAMTTKLLEAQINKLNEETEVLKGGVPAKTIGTKPLADFKEFVVDKRDSAFSAYNLKKEKEKNTILHPPRKDGLIRRSYKPGYGR